MSSTIFLYLFTAIPIVVFLIGLIKFRNELFGVALTSIDHPPNNSKRNSNHRPASDLPTAGRSEPRTYTSIASITDSIGSGSPDFLFANAEETEDIGILIFTLKNSNQSFNNSNIRLNTCRLLSPNPNGGTRPQNYLNRKESFRKDNLKGEH